MAQPGPRGPRAPRGPPEIHDDGYVASRTPRRGRPPRPPHRGHRGPSPEHVGGDLGGPPRGGRWLNARHRMVLPFHLHGARGVLVARGVHGDPPGLTGPLLVLIGGFVILVLG